MGRLGLSQRNRSGRQRRSPAILLVLLLAWSLAIGWGLSERAIAQESDPIPHTGTVDPTPPRYQLGEQLYLENCATCHIPIPPAVLPIETWRDLLQDPQHYGETLDPLLNPQLTIVWNYLRTFSRPLNAEEAVPYRIGRSRYFKALHPEVELPQQVTLRSCVNCHPNASQYDFRTLTPQVGSDR